MAPLETLSVVDYYKRLFSRAAHDARAQINRAGIVVGLILAIGTGYAQSRIDHTAHFGSGAIAACLAAVALAILFFSWHLVWPVSGCSRQLGAR
jgi:hypothetical protein